MKVSNINNRPNQHIIEDVTLEIPVTDSLKLPRKGDMFQSYESNIAFKTYPTVYLDKTYWDYSVTTGKYRNIFLGEKKADTQKKIDSGEYILTDLNE